MAIGYAVLIPARYGSTRLPGKPLLEVGGRYLVQHVQERALRAPGVERVVVLTDDARVEEAVRSYGGEVLRTRADHASGTDRCAEGASRLRVPVVVNLQGDEPLVAPEDLAALAAAAGGEEADLATLAHPFEDDAARSDPHAVKVVVDAGGWALDFRREDPGRGDLPAGRPARVLRHVGVYAFRRTRLLDFAALPATARERSERLEQVRALEHGWRIRVLAASGPCLGVDTPSDLEAFRRLVEDGPPP